MKSIIIFGMLCMIAFLCTAISITCLLQFTFGHFRVGKFIEDHSILNILCTAAAFIIVCIALVCAVILLLEAILS